MVDIFARLDDSYRTGQSVARGTTDGADYSGGMPSKGGFSTRQSQIAPLRDATATRHTVRFLLPETGIVELYVGPKAIKYSDKKAISETRSRNGYQISYWGEELGSLSINGTTGSSGWEGINVLYDIYRNEQVSMDPLALALTAYREQQAALSYNSGLNAVAGNLGQVLQSASDDIFRDVNNVVEYGTINPSRPRPTLASMATSVEMYWCGLVFRGYFTDFSVDEMADSLGIYNYTFTFKVTQRRGLRLNSLPWQRSATNGPSNSDPTFGPPYSFGALRDQIPQPGNNQGVKSPTKKIDALLVSSRRL
jgi:hypothetical protein